MRLGVKRDVTVPTGQPQAVLDRLRKQRKPQLKPVGRPRGEWQIFSRVFLAASDGEHRLDRLLQRLDRVANRTSLENIETWFIDRFL